MILWIVRGSSVLNVRVCLFVCLSVLFAGSGMSGFSADRCAVDNEMYDRCFPGGPAVNALSVLCCFVLLWTIVVTRFQSPTSQFAFMRCHVCALWHKKDVSRPFKNHHVFLTLLSQTIQERKESLQFLWVLVQCLLCPVTYDLQKEHADIHKVVTGRVVELLRRGCCRAQKPAWVGIVRELQHVVGHIAQSNKDSTSFDGSTSGFKCEELIDEWIELQYRHTRYSIEKPTWWRRRNVQGKIWPWTSNDLWWSPEFQRHFETPFRRGSSECVLLKILSICLNKAMSILSEERQNQYLANVVQENAARQTRNVELSNPNSRVARDRWNAIQVGDHEKLFSFSDNLTPLMFVVASDPSETQRKRKRDSQVPFPFGEWMCL